MKNSVPPSRQFAAIILLIGMASSGLAAGFSLSGDTNGALLICAGGIGLAVIVLLFGGLIVAASGTEDE